MCKKDLPFSQHLLWDELTIPLNAFVLTFCLPYFFSPSLCDILANVTHYQEWNDISLCAGLEAERRGPPLLKMLLSLWEQLKNGHGTIPPQDTVFLSAHHTDKMVIAWNRRQSAFASRTGGLSTMQQGLCSWWETLLSLDPSTKVLLNNGICPMPDVCSDKSGKHLGLAGSHASRWAARVNTLVMSKQREGSTPQVSGESNSCTLV